MCIYRKSADKGRTDRPFVSEVQHCTHALLRAKSSFGEALVVFVALLIFGPLRFVAA